MSGYPTNRPSGIQISEGKRNDQALARLVADQRDNRSVGKMTSATYAPVPSVSKILIMTAPAFSRTKLEVPSELEISLNAMTTAAPTFSSRSSAAAASSANFREVIRPEQLADIGDLVPSDMPRELLPEKKLPKVIMIESYFLAKGPETRKQGMLS